MSQIAATLFDMTDNSNPRPPVLVEVNVSWPGWDGSRDETYEVDRDKWDAMTPAERIAYCDDLALTEAASLVGWGWHIQNPDDYAAIEEQK
jgi:hypothetical protein